jgi:ABC-type uncharacterized transport system ATPase subunit
MNNQAGAPNSSAAPAGVSAPFAIEVRGIVKRFPGVVANDGVDVRVKPSSIHAIVGENGAGKSTLMKILYGMQRQDEGTIEMNGEAVSFRSPKDAIARGVGMVHQHFMLANNLTVLENVVLGVEPGKSWKMDRATAKARILELATGYGLDVDPDALVADLGVGQRQRVEILKVLYRGARLLILDEPTAVLVPQEVDELFESLRGLIGEGVTVIFISHKLDEVLSIAEDITVIRAGKTVAEVSASAVTSRDLAELMVGTELPVPEAGESTVTVDEVLVAANITVVDEDDRTRLEDVSITVHRGEIVGIAGVEGNGQSELIEALMGLATPASGTVELDGEDVTSTSTLYRREHGLGYIPQDRHRDGLILPAPLWENAALGHQGRPPYSRRGWMDVPASREQTRQIVEEFDVRTPGVDVPALALSGGNQQKLIFGREMVANPKVMIAAQPTRGIDVGAQAAIWRQIKHARVSGLAVLLISADLEELIGLSDSLLVMYRGTIVADLDPRTVTPKDLGSYMTGANLSEAGS